uniref:Actin n=1 Tax=Ditylenchus dipsaci TaxID=166011 RepID=A0A915CP60_9BILA
MSFPSMKGLPSSMEFKGSMWLDVIVYKEEPNDSASKVQYTSAFRPDLIGEEYDGLAQCVANSILKCDFDLRKTLYQNIVLSGGSTLFAGFGDRLLYEMRRLAPKDVKVRILAPQERLYSTWIGGSILASLDTFRKIWVSKQIGRLFTKPIPKDPESSCPYIEGVLLFVFFIYRMDFANSLLAKLESSGHTGSSEAKDKDEEDRVESLIRGSGCWENHIQVVDCMSEHGDWRKCQEQLSQFKMCMRPNQNNNSATVASTNEDNKNK